MARAGADPAVSAAVRHAGEALGELRWHPAMRRRAAEVRAEVSVRAAASVATVLGARVPLQVVRTLGRVDGSANGSANGGANGSANGSLNDSGDGSDDAGRDPSLAVALRALRSTLLVDGWAAPPAGAPLQILAKLHAAAGVGLLPPDQLGRPRPGTAGGLAAVAVVLSGRWDQAATAVGLRAAVTLAEVIVADAFAPVSAEVGFAFVRGIARWGGLDPMGVGLPEAHVVDDTAGYRRALAGYGEDPVPWCLWWLDALVAGADHGRLAADAVARGRFDQT